MIDNEKTEFSDGNNIPYQAGLSFGGLPTTGTTGATSPLGSIGQNIQREKLTLDLNVNWFKQKVGGFTPPPGFDGLDVKNLFQLTFNLPTPEWA